MFSLFNETGPFGLVLGVILIVTVLLIVVRAYQALSKQEISKEKMRFNNYAILLTGTLGFVIGFMATVIGISRASWAISNASEISPFVIFEGFNIALKTTIIGSIIFIVAAIGWLIIKKLQLKNQ